MSKSGGEAHYGPRSLWHMTLAEFNTIEVRTDGHLAEVVLNQPASHNCISHEMHVELKEAFLLLRQHSDVRAIVLGANGKSFSAGGDFDAILAYRENAEQRMKMRAEVRPLLLAIADSHIPVVTALQGDAIGLGATLIMATDAVVAAKSARISDPHVVIGLAAGDGGCVTWPLHVGLLRAKRYLLTGDRLSAEDAYRIGLVTDIVEAPVEALPAARALAARIAGLPPLAVQATKRTLNQVFRNRLEEVFEQGLAYEMDTFVSEDLAEAIAAFRQKRTPTFKRQ
jgi:enoyl-CoA hydratase